MKNEFKDQSVKREANMLSSRLLDLQESLMDVEDKQTEILMKLESYEDDNDGKININSKVWRHLNKRLRTSERQHDELLEEIKSVKQMKYELSNMNKETQIEINSSARSGVSDLLDSSDDSNQLATDVMLLQSQELELNAQNASVNISDA